MCNLGSNQEMVVCFSHCIPLWLNFLSVDSVNLGFLLPLKIYIQFIVIQIIVAVIQLLSHVRFFATPQTAAHQASLSSTNSWSLLKLMSIASLMPSHNLILCHPCLLPPSNFPSIRIFSNESNLRIRCPKYWSFSYSIIPFNEHSGLISFKIDWLDLFTVHGTQESSQMPHFKSINSLALSFLYSPTLTSTHDQWKNHRSDDMECCWEK